MSSSKKPSPSEVAVSAEVLLFGAGKTLVVSNVTITDDSQCGEAEDTSAFYDLGDAVDRNHLFLQTIVWSVILRFCLKLSHS